MDAQCDITGCLTVILAYRFTIAVARGPTLSTLGIDCQMCWHTQSSLRAINSHQLLAVQKQSHARSWYVEFVLNHYREFTPIHVILSDIPVCLWCSRIPRGLPVMRGGKKLVSLFGIFNLFLLFPSFFQSDNIWKLVFCQGCKWGELKVKCFPAVPYIRCLLSYKLSTCSHFLYNVYWVLSLSGKIFQKCNLQIGCQGNENYCGKNVCCLR